MKDPRRRTSALRKGRVSIPGGQYFLTFVTHQRESILLESQTRKACREATEKMQSDGDWDRIAAMIMPDHIHLLIVLGSRLKLERTVSKWKREVRKLDKWRTICWQPNFYDHRLRWKDRIDTFGRYMFLNPYRAGLISHEDMWNGWFCWKPEWFEFLQLLKVNSNVLKEWLQEDYLPPWKF